MDEKHFGSKIQAPGRKLLRITSSNGDAAKRIIYDFVPMNAILILSSSITKWDEESLPSVCPLLTPPQPVAVKPKIKKTLHAYQCPECNYYSFKQTLHVQHLNATFKMMLPQVQHTMTLD